MVGSIAPTAKSAADVSGHDSVLPDESGMTNLPIKSPGVPAIIRSPGALLAPLAALPSKSPTGSSGSPRLIAVLPQRRLSDLSDSLLITKALVNKSASGDRDEAIVCSGAKNVDTPSLVGASLSRAFSTAAKLPGPTSISHTLYGRAPSNLAEELRKLSGLLPVDEMNRRFSQCGNRALNKQFSPDRMRNRNPKIRPALVTSATVNKLYEETPEPTIRSASLAELLGSHGTSAYKCYGRTVVFEKDGREFALKFAKKSDPAENLSEEWQAIHRIQKLKTALDLKSDYPNVDDPVRTGVFTLSDNSLPRKLELALAKEAAKGDFELADMSTMQVLVYSYPANYHVYLHDTKLSSEELAVASDKALEDLAILASHGLFHTATGDLFHSPHEDRRFRVNYDENNIESTWSAVNEGGTGLLANRNGAVETVNMRKTGLADPKHFKRAEELPLYRLHRYTPERWKAMDEMMSEEYRPVPLDHGDITDAYENSAEFKNVQQSIAERSALIEPLFVWSLSLIRSWSERRDLIRDGATDVEMFNLPEMLRNGLITFFSAYTGRERAEVATALPLASTDPNQHLLIEFDRLDAAIRLFTDGYVERYEVQPHAVMRKSIANRLKDTAPELLAEASASKRQQFLDLANKSLDRYVEPLFNTLDVGLENLAALLHSYPEKMRENICDVMNQLIDSPEPDLDSPKKRASRWYESYAVAVDPKCDAPYDSVEDRDNKTRLIAAIKKTPYRDFDALLHAVLAHKALAEDSPLKDKDEHIATFPDKKELVEQFSIFCRNYTAMKEGDISGVADRLSGAYDEYKENGREQLLAAVHMAASGEAILAELQIDFKKLKQDVTAEEIDDRDTIMQEQQVTSEALPGVVAQNIERFLTKYSNIQADEDRAAVSARLAGQLDLQALAGRPISHADIVRHVFDIDLTGNPFGRFIFPKELWNYDVQSKVLDDGVPDVADPVKLDYHGDEPVPRGYVRGKGNMHDKRRPDFGATNGAFPLTELSTGLIRFIAAAQMVRTADRYQAEIWERFPASRPKSLAD